MKVLFSLLVSSFLIISASAQKIENAYRYKIDITKVASDKLTVELEPPEVTSGPLIFHMPKIVPGTYSIYDFGRFVSNFQAINKKGKRLKVKHPDANTWEIKKHKKLDKIIYEVEDTWDTKKKNKVFEPGGTNIEKELNFVFNNHGFFGFFKGYDNNPFYLEVNKPENFFGGTTLEKVSSTPTKDIYKSNSYNDFVDHPIMYCLPDTVVLKVGNADVLISNYSPNNTVTAEMLAGDIAPILQAQKSYLGGTLPVDKYAFLFYFTDGFSFTMGYGALEHNYSSMYFLPEFHYSQLSQLVRDVAAHEFFHIVTPLNIHSEEIHNFDFLNPQMSEHLWLYEGVVEYFSSHVQVQERLISAEEYLDVLAEKIRGSELYTDDLSFTEMSEGCLHEYKDEYTNVYEKGALIGLCLDLKLIKLSNGEYTLKELMKDLSNEYGKHKPFKDEELFTKIAEYSHPDVIPFFEKHVAGGEPLPIKELLEEVGVLYSPHAMKDHKTLGGIENAFDYDPKTDIFFIKYVDNLTGFGKELGLQKDDVIKTWNGEPLSIDTYEDIMKRFYLESKSGDKFELTISRDGKIIPISGTMKFSKVRVEHSFELINDAPENAVKLRDVWLGDYFRVGEDRDSD